jgi:hypothetical protein
MKNELENNLPGQLAKPTLRALRAAGYDSPEQLSKVTLDELKRHHGIGPNAIKILEKTLRETGPSFLEGEKEKK